MAKKNTGKGPGKRHTKKKASRRVQNAYEIALAQEQGQEESSGSEYESDGGSGGAVVNPKKFRINNEGRGRQGGEDGEEEELEDEEIDSDEAMGSDDDYDVLNSKFSQSLRDRKRSRSRRKRKERRYRWMRRRAMGMLVLTREILFRYQRFGI
jgi:U3 small nucleolar RNA-associated protein 14